MSTDKASKLKQELIDHYADICMQALRDNGVYIADGGRFYEALIDILSTHMSIGDIRS